MATLKRVSGYQTTDGKIFTPDQKNQARDHQKTLNVIDGLNKIGARIDQDDANFSSDAGHHLLIAETFAAFVLANAEDIKAVLSGKELVEASAAAETPAE